MKPVKQIFFDQAGMCMIQLAGSGIIIPYDYYKEYIKERVDEDGN